MSRLSLIFVLIAVVMVFGQSAPNATSPTTPASSTAPSTSTTPKPDNNLLTGLVKAAYDIPKGFFNACTDFKKAVFGGFF